MAEQLGKPVMLIIPRRSCRLVNYAMILVLIFGLILIILYSSDFKTAISNILGLLPQFIVMWLLVYTVIIPYFVLVYNDRIRFIKGSLLLKTMKFKAIKRVRFQSDKMDSPCISIATTNAVIALDEYYQNNSIKKFYINHYFKEDLIKLLNFILTNSSKEVFDQRTLAMIQGDDRLITKRHRELNIKQIFKQTSHCELCQIVLPKRSLFGFDTTLRGEALEGEVLRLCRSCFLKRFVQTIKCFSGKAIFYHPVKSDNAYQFYEFDPAPDTKEALGYNDDFPSKHKSLLPRENQECQICKEKAQFVYCNGTDKRLNLFNMGKYQTRDLTSSYLCPDCLIKTLSEVIVKDGLVFAEYLAPQAGKKDGIFISGEC